MCPLSSADSDLQVVTVSSRTPVTPTQSLQVMPRPIQRSKSSPAGHSCASVVFRTPRRRHPPADLRGIRPLQPPGQLSATPQPARAGRRGRVPKIPRQLLRPSSSPAAGASKRTRSRLPAPSSPQHPEYVFIANSDCWDGRASGVGRTVRSSLPFGTLLVLGVALRPPPGLRATSGWRAHTSVPLHVDPHSG